MKQIDKNKTKGKKEEERKPRIKERSKEVN